MSGLHSKVSDPANFFGSRPGGINTQSALDPGGTIIEAITGSDKASKLARKLDPLKLVKPPSAEPIEEKILTHAEKRKKLIASQLKKKGRTPKGILVTESELDDDYNL